jgi:hypothetical protein
VLARVAGTLVAVGKSIVSSLNVLLGYLLELVSSALTAVVSGFGAAFKAAFTPWNSAWVAASNEIDQYYLASPATRGEYQGTAVSEIGQELTPLLVLMGAFATAVVLASYFLGPFDIAAGVIAGIIFVVLTSVFGWRVSGGAFGNGPKSAESVSFGALSSLTETIFNETEKPLNSSAALAIAVPDGDPWEAAGALTGLAGGIASIFLSAAYGFGGGAASWAATVMIGDIIAFAGIGLAFVTAGALSSLPAPGNSSTAREDYQSDASLAAITAVFGIAGLPVLTLAAAQRAAGYPQVLASPFLVR